MLVMCTGTARTIIVSFCGDVNPHTSSLFQFAHSAQHRPTCLTCPPHPLRKRASLRIIRTATATMVRIISLTPDRDEVHNVSPLAPRGTHPCAPPTTLHALLILSLCGCLAAGQALYTRHLGSLRRIRRPRRWCALSLERPTVTRCTTSPR